MQHFDWIYRFCKSYLWIISLCVSSGLCVTVVLSGLCHWRCRSVCWRLNTCQDSRTPSLQQGPQCDQTRSVPKSGEKKSLLPVWKLPQHATTTSFSRWRASPQTLVGPWRLVALVKWYPPHPPPPPLRAFVSSQWGEDDSPGFWWRTAPTSSGGARHFTTGSHKLWSGAAANKGADTERLEAGEVNRCHLSLGLSGSPRRSCSVPQHLGIQLQFSG